MQVGLIGREVPIVGAAELQSAFGVEGEVDLVAPTQFEAGFTHGVVAILRGGVYLGEVDGVGCEFECDYALANIVLFGQAEVFLGGDVAEHCGSAPTDYRSSDCGGDVVVTSGDVGDEGAEGIEWGFVAPIELVMHVIAYHLHWDVSGALAHNLNVEFPSASGEVALHFEFAELGGIVGVGDCAGAESVAD